MAKVISIRDTRKEPIEAEAIAADPNLNRGRWLVEAEDLDKGEIRHFYFNAMANVQVMEPVECRSLVDAEYFVVEFERVSFKSETFNESLAYQRGRRSGVICAVMSRELEGVQ